MSWSIRDPNLWIRICHTQALAAQAVEDARTALMLREAEEPGVYKLRTAIRGTMAVHKGSKTCMAISVRIQRKDETEEQFTERFPWKVAR